MKATTFQLRFYGQFYHAGIDICRNFNVLAHFQLASNLLPTCFQLASNYLCSNLPCL
jgi:hypothetical protein